MIPPAQENGKAALALRLAVEQKSLPGTPGRLWFELTLDD
jgi:hypothetical protein